MNSKAPRDGDDETRIIRERSAPIKVERLDLEEELFADLPSCVAASARRRHSSEVHMKRQSYDGLLVDEHEAEMAPSIFCVDESAPCGIAGSLLSNTPPGVVTKMERLIQLNENTTTAQLNVARSPSGEKRLCNICHRKAFLLCASCAAEKCHLYKIRTKQTTLEAEKRRLVESIDEILSEEMHLADELSVTSCTVGNLRTLLAFKRHKIRQMKQRLK
uniref:Uncharacterized protein n=1 Tax=Plectus sambesii TaxID=2011161 RepID=A0A914VEX5_9BILA